MGMEVKQYTIVLVDLQDSPGANMAHARPCVVVSPNEMNRYLKTLVVAPVTTRARTYPTRVRFRHEGQTGWIAVDQISTIDRQKVKRNLGKLTNPEIRKLKAVIRETYVD
jgi:mRNA interferase MazF